MTPGAGPRPSRTGISLASCHLSATLLSITLSGKHTLTHRQHIRGTLQYSSARCFIVWTHTGTYMLHTWSFLVFSTQSFPTETDFSHTVCNLRQLILKLTKLNSLDTCINASDAKNAMHGSAQAAHARVHVCFKHQTNQMCTNMLRSALKNTHCIASGPVRRGVTTQTVQVNVQVLCFY